MQMNKKKAMSWHEYNIKEMFMLKSWGIFLYVLLLGAREREREHHHHLYSHIIFHENFFCARLATSKREKWKRRKKFDAVWLVANLAPISHYCHQPPSHNIECFLIRFPPSTHNFLVVHTYRWCSRQQNYREGDNQIITWLIYWY